MENLGQGYQDVYLMPYSRRQRLVQWKVERIEEDKKRQLEAANRARGSRR